MKTEVIPFVAGRKWFEVRNATATSADLFLYDEIGVFGVTAADFITMLNGLKVRVLNVHINSPGGSVFDGLAIHNALNALPAEVVVYVDGIAASIASVIAMAGDEIIMAQNAMMMIHCPSCGVMGYAGDLRKQADVLDVLEGNLVSIYAARTGMAPDELRTAMQAETWFTAEQCKANGFCTSVVAAKKIAAHFDLTAFRNAPTLSSPEENKTPPLSLLLMKQSLLEKQ
tara:strand:- start:3496 stop:4179 length:684 start_codon:yes stop_codon:yes gene_type:complete